MGGGSDAAQRPTGGLDGRDCDYGQPAPVMLRPVKRSELPVQICMVARWHGSGQTLQCAAKRELEELQVL